MTISMYQACVPVLIKQLEAMSSFLAKGEQFAGEQGVDVNELIEGRIAADMFPLARQVQIATDMAKGGAARLAGQTPPSFPDEEKSIPELRERIARTIAYLNTMQARDIDGSEDRPIMLKGGDRELHFVGQAYLLHFVLPNVFFHAATAYDILRGKGVPIGKADFLGGL